MDVRADRAEWLTRVEWGVAVAATLAALWLHVAYLTHAGGLWRDEAGTVALGTLPTLTEMWRMIYAHDSFPVLFPAVVHCWSALGLGSTDFGLRCLGFLIGVGILAAAWVNARLFGISRPLLTLALLAVNLTLVRYGDSLRPYGLGCLLILVTLGLVWSLAKAPSWRRFAAAAVVAVLSVQCFYQSVLLLLAICGAGATVCFRHRQESTGLMILGVGVPAAVSLLPYVHNIFGGQPWGVIERTGFNAGDVFSRLWSALGSPHGWQAVVWFGLGFLGVARGFLSLRRQARNRRLGAENVPLFAALAMTLSVLGFAFFLLIAKLPTEPWYWLPLMPLAAVCAEAALSDWLGRHRIWRVALVAVLFCAPLPAGIRLAKVRHTNVDLLAVRLRDEAKPDDYILVYPWYFGVTFNRYYHGPTPWSTIPALADQRWHRYDLLKERLAAKAPIQAVLDRVGQTLGSGKRVWIVGGLPEAEPDEKKVPDLPPAPESEWGWSDVPYIYVWGRQTEHFLALHSTRTEVLPASGSEAVSILEDAALSVASGRLLSPRMVR